MNRFSPFICSRPAAAAATGAAAAAASAVAAAAVVTAVAAAAAAVAAVAGDAATVVAASADHIYFVYRLRKPHTWYVPCPLLSVQPAKAGVKALQTFCRDLCAEARAGRIDPVRDAPDAPCVISADVHVLVAVAQF